jgi:hypothetical protein
MQNSLALGLALQRLVITGQRLTTQPTGTFWWVVRRKAKYPILPVFQSYQHLYHSPLLVGCF